LSSRFETAQLRAEPNQVAPPSVSYYKDIRPIFQEHCQGCHQPAKRGGEYLMTDFTTLLTGGESGNAAIVPSDPAKSYLLEMIAPGANGQADMPKDKPPLAQVQIDLITRWIAAGAADDTPPSARDQINAANPPVYRQPPVITALDYSPTEPLLAVSGYHEVLLWPLDSTGLPGETHQPARLIGLSERIQALAFSPDGKTLAVAGGSPGRMGEIQFWDVAERRLKLSVTSTYDTIYGVSWSPDGTKVAFGCGDNTVRALESASGKQILYQGAHNDWVLDTSFSTTGSHLISASRDRSLKLIEVSTQRFVDNITSITPGALKGGLAAVDRHPTKDEVVVGGSDGVPKIFRIYREEGKARQIGDDFNLIRNFDALPGRVYAAEYSPDGQRILAGSSHDGTGEVRVYQADDAKLISKSAENLGPIYSATFSPTGQTIAAGGLQGKVHLLDPETGKIRASFVPVPIQN
jgi:DNA-binding beta-propeller fold protein YncE